MLGPIAQKDMKGVHVSPFGVTPKNHQPGKWRLNLDLSSPKGGSMNEGISSQLCSLSYIVMDNTAEIAQQPG